MTRNPKAIFVPFFVVLALISVPLLAQQSPFQTSFLAPAVRVASPPSISAIGITPIVTRAQHLPYLSELARAQKNGTPFQPTASDLLIQQAEERFRAGRKYFRDRDFERARQEFDAAVDLMLAASENPSDRRLFE